MTDEELKKWRYLIKKYPERAGLAYEMYSRHKTKDANPTTYFMWAGKWEKQKEAIYQSNLRKWCDRERVKMELKNG